MGAPTNADIMRELGALSEAVRHGAESRGILHDKVDELAREQGRQAQTLVAVEANVEATKLVATQARAQSEAALQNIHRFEQEFREVQLPIITAAQAFKIEAEPVLSTMKAVQWIVLSLLGMGVLSFGAVMVAAIWFRDLLAMGVRILLNVDV